MNLTGYSMRTNIGRMLTALAGVYRQADDAGNFLNGGQKDIVTGWADRVRTKLEALFPQVTANGNPVTDSIQSKYNQAKVDYDGLNKAVRDVGLTSYLDVALESVANLPDAVGQELGQIAGGASNIVGSTAGNIIKNLISSIGVPGLALLAVVIIVIVARVNGFNPLKLLKFN